MNTFESISNSDLDSKLEEVWKGIGLKANQVAHARAQYREELTKEQSAKLSKIENLLREIDMTFSSID